MCVSPAFANPAPDAAFDAANRLYAQNKFTEAAAAYEELAQSGTVSSALLFNLGNANFKAGQLGRAIAAYRRATELSPRDPDLRANLQFVRTQVAGPTLRVNAFQRSLALFSLNEWAGLTTGAFWITFILLALRQLRPPLAGALRSWTALAAGVTVILALTLAYVARLRLGTHMVVVTAHEASMRNSPLDGAPTAFPVNDGAELRVLDSKEEWLEVTDGARRVGWLKRDRVVNVQ